MTTTFRSIGFWNNPGETAAMAAPGGYFRDEVGQPFRFEKPWPQYNHFTPAWIECGVSIP